MTWVDNLSASEVATLRDSGRIGASRFDAPVPRPEPLIPSSWIELDSYLVGFATRVAMRFDETTASEAVAEIRERIAHMVAAEMVEREQVAGEDSVEQQYKAVYGPEPIAPWQAEDR